jgi:hypothetical protein
MAFIGPQFVPGNTKILDKNTVVESLPSMCKALNPALKKKKKTLCSPNFGFQIQFQMILFFPFSILI